MYITSVHHLDILHGNKSYIHFDIFHLDLYKHMIYSTRQNYGKKTFQFTGAACL